LAPLVCFTEMSGGPMWRFLKRRHVMKEGDFSPRYMNNSDEVSYEKSQASDKFHCTGATAGTNMFFFTIKATYQWSLHGLVIQILLFHCDSSVANDLKMQHWRQQN
jgi:hypothetical protein